MIRVFENALSNKLCEEIIKENEDLIIDDNKDFIVVNKNSGIPVQGGTKSKKNLIDINLIDILILINLFNIFKEIS